MASPVGKFTATVGFQPFLGVIPSGLQQHCCGRKQLPCGRVRFTRGRIQLPCDRRQPPGELSTRILPRTLSVLAEQSSSQRICTYTGGLPFFRGVRAISSSE